MIQKLPSRKELNLLKKNFVKNIIGILKKPIVGIFDHSYTDGLFINWEVNIS